MTASSGVIIRRVKKEIVAIQTFANDQKINETFVES